MDRPPPRNHRVSFHLRLHHPSMDPANDRAQSQRQRLLHPVLRPGCLGSNPDPFERAESPGIQIFIPGYHVPNRKYLPNLFLLDTY